MWKEGAAAGGRAGSEGERATTKKALRNVKRGGGARPSHFDQQHVPAEREAATAHYKHTRCLDRPTENRKKANGLDFWFRVVIFTKSRRRAAQTFGWRTLPSAPLRPPNKKKEYSSPKKSQQKKITFGFVFSPNKQRQLSPPFFFSTRKHARRQRHVERVPPQGHQARARRLAAAARALADEDLVEEAVVEAGRRREGGKGSKRKRVLVFCPDTRGSKTLSQLYTYRYRSRHVTAPPGAGGAASAPGNARAHSARHRLSSAAAALGGGGWMVMSGEGKRGRGGPSEGPEAAKEGERARRRN